MTPNVDDATLAIFQEQREVIHAYNKAQNLDVIKKLGIRFMYRSKTKNKVKLNFNEHGIYKFHLESSKWSSVSDRPVYGIGLYRLYTHMFGVKPIP